MLDSIDLALFFAFVPPKHKKLFAWRSSSD